MLIKLQILHQACTLKRLPELLYDSVVVLYIVISLRAQAEKFIQIIFGYLQSTLNGFLECTS